MSVRTSESGRDPSSEEPSGIKRGTRAEGHVGRVVELLRSVGSSAHAAAVTCLLQPPRAASALRACARGEALQVCTLESHLSPMLAGIRPLDEGVLAGAIDVSDLDPMLGMAPRAERTWLYLTREGAPLAVLAFDHDPSHTAFDRVRVEGLVDVLKSALSTSLELIDTECELAVTRAVGAMHDVLLVFDIHSGRVVWASSQGRPLDAASDLEDAGLLLARHLPSLVAAQECDESVPTLPRLRLGSVQSFAVLPDRAPFGARCAVAGIVSSEGFDLQLSARERQVAELLARGYEPVNIAAIASVSEHTVRTYIRRTYKKLGVRTRAELVRRLLAPYERPSSRPRAAR